MGRRKRNNVYCYFTLAKEAKQSTCLLCRKVLNTNHGANLLKHIKSKHEREYEEVVALNNGNVEYEYVLEMQSPATSDDDKSLVEEDIEPRINRSSSAESSFSEDARPPKRAKKDRLNILEELAQEKLTVASLQKKLIEKQIKKEDMQMAQLKEDVEHKKIMRELEKQEIQLRIESLKANFGRLVAPGSVFRIEADGEGEEEETE